MLIGASGKIGGVVLKNLQCIEGAKVCTEQILGQRR